MIKELPVDFEIKECCEALRVSRSGYYRWRLAEPSRREKENAELVEQIREVFEANKSRYGSPRVTRELRQRGLQCGQNRIARLMRENRLAACAKKAFHGRPSQSVDQVLDSPTGWEGKPISDDEKRAILDELKQQISEMLPAISEERLRKLPLADWQVAYALRGKGATVLRRQRVRTIFHASASS